MQSELATCIIILRGRATRLKTAARQLPMLNARIAEMLRRHTAAAKKPGNRALIASLRRKISVVVGVRRMYRKYTMRLQDEVGNMLEDLVLAFENAGINVHHGFFVDYETYRYVYHNSYADGDDDYSDDDNNDDDDSESDDDNGTDYEGGNSGNIDDNEAVGSGGHVVMETN